MPDRPLDPWINDLEAALCVKSRFWMRGALRPKVSLLPRLWAGYGAWTLVGRIFITRKLAACPEHVRRYIICHELAHVWLGHVHLQIVFALSYATILLKPVDHVVIRGAGLLLTIVSYLWFVIPRLSLARECSADSVAVELHGARMTLMSSLWMAQRVNDIDTRERQARLDRLRAACRAAASSYSS